MASVVESSGSSAFKRDAEIQDGPMGYVKNKSGQLKDDTYIPSRTFKKNLKVSAIPSGSTGLSLKQFYRDQRAKTF